MPKTDIDESTEEKLKFDIQNKIDKDAETAHDDIKDFYEYKKHLRESTKKQIDFKDNIRGWSLLLFGLITIVLSLNLFVLLYLQGFKTSIWGLPITVPKSNTKLLIFFASVTFVNIFGIITFLFKYIFSPIQDILTHNKDISK
ncbi:hypothetical protein JGT54_05230 [Staphylococcus aureus]|uniref:hypothetical protein n=1 Tax=Staphylococcus aureus TaxID=1280 RepID=UPI0018E9AA89|nr:hypothetical protein [Staphylococcus aureus]MBJ6128898.1 hypothetical protein [Staphylococcus aureus]MBJ6141232.1 hypothetical protein [Staphylococcus aureus]MBJ6153758.1 hypothetical protein [Staphylococcus aureus]MBJ6156667.1 hypothetical protein [Staphylococcus aureus]MBJ6158148.1 hypothetical protein [Staphylococcus aureus]